MQIFGDIKTSNKFFVYLDEGGLIWTSSFKTAERYISNPRYKDWYNKPLYCTNEDIVKGYDGKLYVKSQCPTDPNAVIVYDNYKLFVENAKRYIKGSFDDVITESPFDSALDAYTYTTSKIKEYKQLSKKIFEFRDNMYLFLDKILKKYEKDLVKTEELLDLSYIYDDFMNNIPKFNQDDE